jgi:hypothetical protein
VPIIKETEQCQRCKSEFNALDNREDACVFHADAEGREGEFLGVGTDSLGRPIRAWSCCGSKDKDLTKGVRMAIIHLFVFSCNIHLLT